MMFWQSKKILVFALSFCILGLLEVTAASAQEDVQETEEPIRVDVNLVTLRFTVRDRDGHFSNRLPADAFEVIENGRQKEIAFFDQPRGDGSEEEPLWLAFLLDVSGSTFATRAEEILAAQSFFENIHNFTRVAIYGFTDELLPFQEFTSDRRAALDAFSAAHAHLGKTAIYDSVNSLISLMNSKAGSGHRKVIIVISDGMDDKYQKWSNSSAMAQKNGVNVFTVWVPSAAQLYIGPARGESNVPADRSKQEKETAFAMLSATSGGRHFGGFEAILNFDEVLAEINDELFGNLYSIGYYTDNPYLDRFDRNIQVTLNRPNVAIQGLFENLPDRIQAKKRYIEALFESQPTSTLPPGGKAFHELGADIDLLRQRKEGDSTVMPFRLKISSYSLSRTRGGGVRTQLGVIGLLTDLDGNEVGRLREVFRANVGERELRDGRGIIYTNRLLAPPGNYLFKVAVLEIPTWRMTVLERSIQIQ